MPRRCRIYNAWWIYFKLYWGYLIHSELKTEACTNGTEGDSDINYEGSDAKLFVSQTNVPVTTKLRNQAQI